MERITLTDEVNLLYENINAQRKPLLHFAIIRKLYMCL